MASKLFYQYIASANPTAAKAVLQSFGYKLASRNTQMWFALQQLVAKEGEEALKAIADIHPDKGLIVELFGQEECNCSEKGNDLIKRIENHLNASGGASNQNVNRPVADMSSQYGVFILGASLLLACAIISKK